MDKIEIVIVTGMSGAGKTTAMAAFENMAYCCIDNYPIALLGAFSEFLKDNTNYQRIAMAVSLADAPKAIRFLNNVDWLNVSVIFLDCDDKIILNYENLKYYLIIPTGEVYSKLNEIKNAPYVRLKDNILGFETPPVIENGSMLVPMRFLFEQMGADVEWNQETQTATATLDNKAVTFSIDNVNARINNKSAKMDVPARLVNGKTMVPLRFLSENMGYDVDWDADSRTAIVNS